MVARALAEASRPDPVTGLRMRPRRCLVARKHPSLCGFAGPTAGNRPLKWKKTSGKSTWTRADSSKSVVHDHERRKEPLSKLSTDMPLLTELLATAQAREEASP